MSAESKTFSQVRNCPVCSQEMHPTDYHARLRTELAAANARIAELETINRINDANMRSKIAECESVWEELHALRA